MRDTRVGYATLEALLDVTKDYIDTHCDKERRYTGDQKYLVLYSKLLELYNKGGQNYKTPGYKP